MTVLVLGAGGQLGTDLLAVLGENAHGLTRSELDVGDAAAVLSAIREARPEVVYNAAAWTDVDGAETDEGGATRINAEAPGHIARACGEVGATLVHVSTDYVFAGDATTPYDVDTPPAPRSAYGRTKLAGEGAVRATLPQHYVVRTAWVYGCTGANFVKTMARLEKERETLTVVDDQRGAPTWSRHLAHGLVALAGSGAPFGTYHLTGSGETTWHGFARAIFEELGADPARVLPCTTADFPRPAPRPAYSVLSDRAWRDVGFPPMAHWREALADAFAECGDALRG